MKALHRSRGRYTSIFFGGLAKIPPQRRGVGLLVFRLGKVYQMEQSECLSNYFTLRICRSRDIRFIFFVS